MKNSNGYIFVLMPFNKEFDDIYLYGIKTTCNDLNFYCERIDEQVFEGTILTRIYNQIQTADLIISDMSHMNPNVFYETRYAHALEKDVILLTQNSNDIPFDLKHYPHIVYNKNIKYLSDELTKKLNWRIENKNSNRKDLSGFLEIYNEGKLVKDGSSVVAKWIEREDPLIYDDYQEQADKRIKELGELKITFNIYNSGSKTISNFHDLGLIVENVFLEGIFLERKFESIIKLPDNNVLIKIDSYLDFHPQTWSTLVVNRGERKYIKKEFNEATIRVFKEDGVHDIPINVEYQTFRLEEKEYE